MIQSKRNCRCSRLLLSSSNALCLLIFPIRKRKRTIARTGATYLRPPGIPKTLQAMIDEAAERAEQEVAQRRELALAQEQAAAEEESHRLAAEMEDAEAEGMEVERAVPRRIGAAPGMERDLDDDVPDAPMDDDEDEYESDDDEDDEGMEDDDDEDGIEQDLDDSIPEAGSYQHTDTEVEDTSTIDNSFTLPASQPPDGRPARYFQVVSVTPARTGGPPDPRFVAHARAQAQAAGINHHPTPGQGRFITPDNHSAVPNYQNFMPRAEPTGRGRAGTTIIQDTRVPLPAPHRVPSSSTANLRGVQSFTASGQGSGSSGSFGVGGRGNLSYATPPDQYVHHDRENDEQQDPESSFAVSSHSSPLGGAGRGVGPGWGWRRLYADRTISGGMRGETVAGPGAGAASRSYVYRGRGHGQGTGQRSEENESPAGGAAASGGGARSRRSQQS